ncbi:MAG: NAD(P)(+) transhydrogenase (Re/Si-specific) subunit beta [Alphaproteobacteria bacterium]|nr:NAD(P)(+) transhydrogenase (Re/Si-specific) subunit beta [Alphaproteobacteria bacterium]
MHYITEFAYLFAAICFIASVKGLSSHKDSNFGTLLGIVGMVVAIVACIFTTEFYHKWASISAILSGAAVGTIITTRIAMTSMPQLVAGFHSLVGLSAVLVAYSAYLAPDTIGIVSHNSIKIHSLIEMSIGASIGAITFTGSIIAFAKLQGLMSASVIRFTGQAILTVSLSLLTILCIILFSTYQSTLIFNILVMTSLALGVLLIIPVGGADMPVVVSMLNSYSGWAASGIGFTLSNDLLIITGALVGASGAILSHIMCSAMNRSLFTVIFGAFFLQSKLDDTKTQDDRIPNISSSEDAAFALENASKVIIVPGYGMAVAQAQHILKELVEKLINLGVSVRFAIHPVAGRMPGHMNVLLAEANIPHEIVFELEEINNQFQETDITIVIGANDVTNPAAKNDKSSPIYGMPILEVENSRTVYFIKRSMGSGYAGIDNELFFYPNTYMLFGDAKKVLEGIVKSLA